jgi:hypothetical protein
MNIAGLPAHVLVIHAAVVFGPLAALSALAYVAAPYAGRPGWRDTLRWPTLVLVVVAVGAIWAAYLTGVSFFASDRFAGVSGELAQRIQKHQNFAGTLRWIATAFGVVTVAATYLHDRAGSSRTLLGALVAVTAIGTLVWVVLTGDAGARSAWG